MASRHCKNIDLLTNSDIHAFIDSFDTILCDVDGVLRTGSHVIGGSPEVIQAFKELGKQVYYVSNNCMQSRKTFLERFVRLGYHGNVEDVFTTSYLCAQYLKEQHFSKTAYVLGPKGIQEELDEVGIGNIGYGPDPTPENWYNPDVAKNIVKSFEPDIGCVIAGLTYDISYMKLIKAISYLDNPDVIFLGTSMDKKFQVAKGFTVPADGAFVATVQTATGRSATTLGKPNRYMFEAIKALHPGITAERTLMIGDSPTSDVLFGNTCGLMTLMVGTGSGTLDGIRKWEMNVDEKTQQLIPDFYINRLGDLLPHLKRHL